jgi:acyl-coenzyme A synthetase/AMP-(fatty) acid ligase
MEIDNLFSFVHLKSKIEKSNFLYSVGSGGESLGEELIKWGQETLGLTINEFYGQTGCD